MTSSPGGAWVVIGGGIAGLLAARRLAKEGHSVMLLERGDALGGRVSHIDVAGLTLDAGAESFATRGDAVHRLCVELGLGDRVVEPSSSPAWVISPRRAYPLPATGWLGIPLRPFAADVRHVLGWWGALRACADFVLPTRGIGEDATVGSLARARLGRRAADRLLAPVMSGVYSRPLDDLRLDAIAPGLSTDVRERGGLIRAARSRRSVGAPGSAVRGLVGGVFTLAQAVAADAEGRGAVLRTGVEVTGLSRAEDGVGWRLSTSVGPLAADGVVVAVPRHEAVPLLSGKSLSGAPLSGAPLSGAPLSGEPLSGAPIPGAPIPGEPLSGAPIPGEPLSGAPLSGAPLPGEAPEQARLVAIVVMVVDAPALDAAPRGTGVLVRPGVTRAKALTHASAKWPWLAAVLPPGRHVVRLSYAVTPGEDVTGYATADASRLLGVALDDGDVVGIAASEWPDASPASVASTEPMRGVHLVGSAAGLSGLAAIVAADAAANYS